MQNSDLFSSFKLGTLTLSNRIVMAPLTRSRAGVLGIQGALNAKYYAQRSTAGLIISEATNISPQGRGYAFTPGIYNQDQISGWKMVTDAVHKAGGYIFCQLWHTGRVSHPALQPNNELPVAPSAINPNMKAFTEQGMQETVTPRALELSEIPQIIDQYRQAAINSQKAGFDGVEIHSANGYLLNQFICDQTNIRTDQYGGSIENRIRLVLEVTQAVVDIWGGDKVGIRISPVSPANGISDSNPWRTFSELVHQLNPLNLAYIHVVEGATGGPRDINPEFNFKEFRKKINTVYMANNGYDTELALEARKNNDLDLVCIGKPFISNPDLVYRMKINAKLNPFDSTTFYGGDEKGYTDYPSMSK